MIDIVGNIKVDESKPERVRALIACIRSYAFLGNSACFVLFLEDASGPFRVRIEEEVKKCGFLIYEVFNGDNTSKCYGQAMVGFLKFAQQRNSGNDFVLNFMEDHFMMVDNVNTLANLLGFMREHNADLCKATFFQVEQKSKTAIKGKEIIADIPGLGFCFHNTAEKHLQYCEYYGNRYYIGVNFLTTREFALRFWNRALGPSPHGYEITLHDPVWQHRCVIPGFEVQAAIDDPHGEWNSHLLARLDAKKFWDIYNSINQ